MSYGNDLNIYQMFFHIKNHLLLEYIIEKIILIRLECRLKKYIKCEFITLKVIHRSKSHG